MSHDRYEYAGMIVTAFATAICTVAAVAHALRVVKRAKFDSDQRLRRPPVKRLRGALAFIRPWLPPVPAVSFLAILAISLIYQYGSLTKTAVPLWHAAPPQGEINQSSEWRVWREEVHDILTSEPVSEQSLGRALRVKRPALPETHTEADSLRRDMVVAEVFLSYPEVKKIFSDRFGIRGEFLGTGLSKPLGATAYSSASVHEYLVENHGVSTHPHVWVWKITTFGGKFSLPIETLLSGDAPDKPEKKYRTEGQERKEVLYADELKEILLRVKNKEHPFPPMIRFARFDGKYYQDTVGRPNAYRVFTSNLTEVWDLTIQQAAEKSGYTYKDGGDTLFIWVYLPYHSDEFTIATWRQLLARMPDWLDVKKPID